MESGDIGDGVRVNMGFGTLGAIPVLRPPWGGAPTRDDLALWRLSG